MMRHTRRTSRRSLVIGIVMGLVLVASGTSAPATADVPAYFVLSHTFGQPGMTVDVSQGNSCPAGSQAVVIDFIDTSGIRYNVASVAIEANGAWQQWIHYSAPITVAVGQGQFKARCVGVYSETLLTYEPQPYTIVGPVPILSTSKATYERGETLSVTSTSPCPTPFTKVTGAFGWKPGGFFPFALTVTSNPTSGRWTAQAVILRYYPNSTTPIPVGDYHVTVNCTGAAGGRDLLYETKEFKVRAAYVALGDSNSSGEGTFNYDSASGGCHRSPDGYVDYVANHMKLPSPVFGACSGAQTDDFYVGNPVNTAEPAQLSRLGVANPNFVTLTIGGNDAGFESVMTACADHPNNNGWGCSNNTTLNTNVTNRINALAGIGSIQTNGRTVHSLIQVYRDVHAAAPAAKIYVGGYPHLFGSNKAHYTLVNNAPGGATCAAPAGVTFSYNDAQWLNAKANSLNDVVLHAVAAAKNEGINITFVPAALFSGHGLCDSSDQWFQDVVFDGKFPVPGPLPESLHPTNEGYQNGYGIAFVSAMN